MDYANMLAPTGTLRAALNLTNAALVAYNADGSIGGRSAELAGLIGQRFGLRVDLIGFASAAKIVAAAEADEWDIAFIAVDPAREDRFAFSRPYSAVEVTFAVPRNSSFATPSEIDVAGIRVASAHGSAYDLLLRRSLKHAQLVSCDTTEESFDLLMAGGADCVACVREALMKFVAHASDYRVLGGTAATIDQAVAVKRERASVVPFLSAIIAEAV